VGRRLSTNGKGGFRRGNRIFVQLEGQWRRKRSTGCSGEKSPIPGQLIHGSPRSSICRLGGGRRIREKGEWKHSEEIKRKKKNAWAPKDQRGAGHKTLSAWVTGAGKRERTGGLSGKVGRQSEEHYTRKSKGGGKDGKRYTGVPGGLEKSQGC